MRKRETQSLSAVGAASLLTAFGVLCLTVFALLGLSTAQAEERLADSSLEAISAYYEADLQAEEIFARLRNGEIPPAVTRQDDRYSYTCPISGRQYLAVEVALEQGRWQVLRWQSVTREAGAEDTTLDLWSGSEEGP